MPTATDPLIAALERQWRRAEAAIGYAVRPGDVLVGQTPRQLVWQKNKAKLYRYEGVGPRKHATPLLLVYALINKPYIMDLLPGNSLIEHLLAEGFDVFMLDWGVAGEEDAGMRLEDYVLDYLPRVAKAVIKSGGAHRFSLLGYCMGGTLSACFAAATADNADIPLANLVLLTTPIDFADAGLYSNWLQPDTFDIDRVVGTLPLVPPDMIQVGSKWLKPLQNYAGPLYALADKLDDPAFVTSWRAMDRWVNDGTPFPGAAYYQWITKFYQGNQLVQDQLVLGGQKVLLGAIKANLLNVVASLDHICPPHQSEPLMNVVGSADKTLLTIQAGHVGVVAGRGAKEKFFPKLVAWLAERDA